MFARILFSSVFVVATASQAVGQQYYIPEQQPNTVNPGAPAYSLTDAAPAVRPASTPIPAGRNHSPAVQPTAPIGNSYLHNNQAGCCESPASGCGSTSNCAGSPACGGNDCGCNECACPTPPGSRYLKVFGGWNEAYDIDVPQTASTFDLASGWAMGAGVGRQLTCNLRHEIEFTYRNNSATERTIQGAGAPQVDALDGNLNCFSSANLLLYDLHRLKVGGMTPYVGGGVGGAYVDADFSDGVNTYAISDIAFSYQGILGVQRQMGCRATAFAEYRYFGTTNVELETLNNEYDVTYQTQGVFVGIRLAR